jgi:hypothetical protein
MPRSAFMCFVFCWLFGTTVNAQITSTAWFSSGTHDTITMGVISPDSILYAPNATVETFFKCGSLTGAHCIFLYQYSFAPDFLYCFVQNGNTVRATDIASFNMVQPIDTQWHHIALCRHASDSVYLFIDGIKVDSSAAAPLPTSYSEKAFVIGNNVGSTQKFEGNITQFRMSPSVLYTTNFVDTCAYSNTYFYAPLNNLDDSHVIINGVSYHIYTDLSAMNPCSSITSVSTIERKENIEVFPNPSHGQITIRSPKTISEIEIRNVLGQVVYTQKISSNEASINTGELPRGIYFLKVDGSIHKVVLQ